MTAEKVKKMLDNGEIVYFQNTDFKVLGSDGEYAMSVIEIIDEELVPKIINLSIESGKIKDRKTGDLFNPDDFFGDPKFLCIIENKGITQKFFIFDEELYNKNVGRLKAEGMTVKKRELKNNYKVNYALAKFIYLKDQGFEMVLC